ncbi:MAG: acyltransferase family protein [Pseudonocardia sp.]|nr:acyltransferase family protein [Pseudonocardia sp.]
MPPAITGLAGLAVLVVALQSSGGFAVELLGPDLVLAVGGFVVTFTVLGGGPGGRVPLRAWYGDQVRRHVPLLVLVLLVVLAAMALVGRQHQIGQAAADAAGGLLGVQNWVEVLRAGALPLPRADVLAPAGDWYTTRDGRVDPFGTLWLVALLVQFTLVWPLLLVGLRRLLRARGGRRVLRLVPAVVALAIVAVLAGVVRARFGADPAELAFGSHLRVAEWLLGAAAGAAAAGLPPRSAASPRPSRRPVLEGETRAQVISWGRGNRAPWALAGVGVAGLVVSGTIATLHREAWLVFGGPAAAAAAAAALLLAVHLDGGTPAGPIAGTVGRGLPVELGRSAYPLLLLHAPLFWLVQEAVPAARPFALIAVGGALAWVAGLLVQDGLLRRLRRGSARRRLGIVTGLAVALLAGASVSLYAADARPLGPGAGPTVLVLGGSSGADAAAALAASPFTVVDATRSGCGLLPVAAVPGSPARPTALGQAPAAAPDCADPLGWWRSAVAAARPAAVVVDLSADAGTRPATSRLPGPCDPAFRPLYRALVADAVTALTADSPARPILVTTGRDQTGADGSRRCLDALVVEAAMTHPEVVAFDPAMLLCPAGYCPTVGERGAPLLPDGVHLTDAGISALAAPLGQLVATELGP